MSEYTPEELQEMLELHRKWLRSEDGGRRIILYRANLTGADLSGADLTGADLTGADLSGADLTGANLSGANLYRANLSDADLYRANLTGADLSDADLTGADLYRANLSGADLTGADLTGANLYRANLSRAVSAGLARAMTEIVPREGEFAGWKKAESGDKDCIVKLWIPADAKRSNATGRKCRCSHARVISIADMDGNPLEEACSIRDSSFAYRVGETVSCNEWDENRFNECSGGIHFFITEEEARAYEY